MQIQGQTVPNPTAVVVDFRGANRAAMIYVMLSRAQTIEQIFILDSLRKEMKGWKPDPSALEEFETTKMKAINTAEETEVDVIKVLCLNVWRLRKHFDDVVRTVQAMSMPAAICLQETWLEEGSAVDKYQMQDLSLIVNSIGEGRGVATYFDDTFDVTDSVTSPSCQITRISSNEIDVINVYRSKDCDMKEFELMIFKMIDRNDLSKKILICGDLNIHFTKETSNHFIRKIVDEYQFKQLVMDPTHDKGNTIDHVYVSPALQGRVMIEKTSIYYSDHDLLTIKIIEDKGAVDEMSVSD